VKPKSSLVSSDSFIDLAEQHVNSVINLLLSENIEFSVITKPKYMEMRPHLDSLFKKPDEYIKFDLIGYSFETSNIIDNKFMFRAGFGQGKNITESEVSINLSNIFQITTTENGDKPILMNFSEPLEKRNVDRSKMFLSKNRETLSKT